MSQQLYRIGRAIKSVQISVFQLQLFFIRSSNDKFNRGFKWVHILKMFQEWYDLLCFLSNKINTFYELAIDVPFYRLVIVSLSCFGLMLLMSLESSVIVVVADS